MSLKDQLVAFVHAFFADAMLTHCQDPQCLDLRENCDNVVPPCRWKPFRDFVVTWVACWLRHTCEAFEKFEADMPLKDLSQEDWDIPPCPLVTNIRQEIFSQIRGVDESTSGDVATINEIVDIFEWLCIYFSESDPELLARSRDLEEGSLWPEIQNLV